MFRTRHRMHGNEAASFLSARVPSFVCLSVPSLTPRRINGSGTRSTTTLLHASSTATSGRHRYFEAAPTDRWSASLYRSSGTICLNSLSLHEERLPSVGKGTHHTRGRFLSGSMSGETDAGTGGPSPVCGGAARAVAVAAAAVAEKGQEEQLVLNREEFAKEFSVVAVKIPARRTR